MARIRGELRACPKYSGAALRGLPPSPPSTAEVGSRAKKGPIRKNHPTGERTHQTSPTPVSHLTIVIFLHQCILRQTVCIIT